MCTSYFTRQLGSQCIHTSVKKEMKVCSPFLPVSTRCFKGIMDQIINKQLNVWGITGTLPHFVCSLFISSILEV